MAISDTPAFGAASSYPSISYAPAFASPTSTAPVSAVDSESAPAAASVPASLISRRASVLPGNPFAQADARAAAAVAAGGDIIDLSKGNPDGEPPKFVSDALAKAAYDRRDFGYIPFDGKPEFLSAAAGWYRREHGVELDPSAQLLATSGSSVGIATVIETLVDPGDLVVVVGPYYPQYEGSTAVAQGRLHVVPVDAERGFLPDLDGVDPQVWDEAKLLILNYPNNPTGAVASAALFESAVALAKRHHFAIMNDFAYAGLGFDAGVSPRSLLATPGALDVAVELCSMSKMYMVAGWRGGFIAGNAELVAAAKAVHRQTTVLASSVIQDAGTVALNSDQSTVRELAERYRGRYLALRDGLAAGGLRICEAHGGLFAWMPVPDGRSSAEYADRLLREAGVAVMPGSCFGPDGEGYVRLSLLRPQSDLEQAARRIVAMSAAES